MKYGNEAFGCGNCECKDCLHWWKGDCQNGKCFDDLRAKIDPYTDHRPERHFWIDSHKPGEQEHWCRGGITYPVTGLPCYIPYQGSKIEPCFGENIVRYQDGSMKCYQIDYVGCAECIRRWEQRHSNEEDT